jgi:CBS domain containing-hemolysin-like protein
MGTTGAGDPSLATWLVALGGLAVAGVAAGMLAAFARVSGLHGHGLLEDASLGATLARYLREPRRLVITTGTLYLAATVAAGAAAERLAAAYWPLLAPGRRLAGVVLVMVPLWYLSGLAARALAARAPVGYARWLGLAMAPLHWLLRPWAALWQWVADRGADPGGALETPPLLSAEEIRSLIDEDQDGVALEEDEREMIHSIFGFGDTTVREIMVPRIDIVAVDAADPIEVAVAAVNASRHSRLPVFEGTIDHVTGLLYAKDLLALLHEGRMVTAGKSIGELVRPAYFIPESKKIDEVLAEFRKHRIHMAIVIDEYGGTAGVVTMEDVLEEIVGEIEDEFDDSERLFEWLGERALRVDPKIDLEDLREILGTALPAGDSETLAGLVYEAAGRVPEVGDQVTVGDLLVTVEAVEDQRILQVRLDAAAPLPGFAARAEEEV